MSIPNKKQILLAFGLCLIFLVQDSQNVSLEEDLTLSYSQKIILDQFREIVSSSLTHDYMKRDIYLIRWLRARNFNLMDAAVMLAQNLQWRRENKIDTIIYEDWSEFEMRFPYYLQGCDKEMRPVASVPVAEWDVRRAVLAGDREKMMRYFDKLIEEINVLVRKGQDAGENITQYSLIFDMGNYNIVEQGCGGCIPIYLHMFQSYESHYLGNIHKMYLLNTPPIFQTLFSLIRPILSPITREALEIHGTNKAEWRKALLKDIDPNQLSKFYGGNNEIEGYEPEEVRKWDAPRCNAKPETQNVTTSPSTNNETSTINFPQVPQVLNQLDNSTNV